MHKNNLSLFCKIIRKRSADHNATVKLISHIPSSMISILRQELDSLIRVVYLLSIPELNLRNDLITQTLNNQPWSIKTNNGKIKKITDSEMVELASGLIGWTRSVYKFGCAFIHLSGFHDYEYTNPFNNLSSEDKTDILSHMRQYHGGPISNNPSFEEFVILLPAVFKKISENLECYIEHLESNKILKNNEI